MMKMNELQKQLPEMLTGEELRNRIQVLPEYNDNFQDMSATERLTLLNELYNIYVPSAMSNEIYTKLYLATLRSLGKKNTIETTQQYYQNYRAIKQQEHHGIIGGSDSFTIIGGAGIGKSSAIFRAITLISQGIIEIEKPYVKIVPCIVVQCPFDSSVKSLLLEILRKIDEAIDSNYHEKAIKARATTDMLIGSVSQACLIHVGLLIIDEIQNVANSKNGKNLIGSLTQLINNSGISIWNTGLQTFPRTDSIFGAAFLGAGIWSHEIRQILYRFLHNNLELSICSEKIRADTCYPRMALRTQRRQHKHNRSADT